MYVLRRCREALRPDGILLDLQVIRPNPLIEVDGRVLCEADGEPLFAYADAARAAVDRDVAEGLLEEDAFDDHDVRQHYRTGAELVDDWQPKKRRLPDAVIPALRAIQRECVVRERCRLRRLRRLDRRYV